MNDVLRFLNTEKGKKFILILLGALILIGGVALVYDYDQWTAHEANQAKIDALNKEILNARRLALTVAQTAEIRVKMQHFIDSHESTMVSGDQFAWVIREISQLAESQGMGNVITQPGVIVPHPRKPMRQSYVTHLEFTGDYDQIGAFIQALENHFPEAEIRSLNIVATEIPAVHRAAVELALLIRPAPVSNPAPGVPKTDSKS